MVKFFKLPVLLVLTAFFGLVGQAHAKDPIYTSFFGNTAIGGYDAVTYFDGSDGPQKGSKKFKTEWRGATWQFASQENLDKFVAAPENFAPQYGGYCAWAMAEGNFASGDPLVYDMVDGKLFLNYDKKIQDKWTKDKTNFIRLADVEYPKNVTLK